MTGLVTGAAAMNAVTTTNGQRIPNNWENRTVERASAAKASAEVRTSSR